MAKTKAEPLFSKESIAKLTKRKQIEDTPEVMELRRLRDEAAEKSREYQRQIDEKIKALHQVPDIIGKFIKVERDNVTHYGLVSKVDRLFDGIRIYYQYAFNTSSYALGSIVSFSDSGKLCYSDVVYWDDLDKIKFTTREEFNKTLLEYINNFVQKQEV